MNCESCSSPMNFLYEVSERETVFLLWECECGHKLLERKPLEKVGAGAQATVNSRSD